MFGDIFRSEDAVPAPGQPVSNVPHIVPLKYLWPVTTLVINSVRQVVRVRDVASVVASDCLRHICNDLGSRHSSCGY